MVGTSFRGEDGADGSPSSPLSMEEFRRTSGKGKLREVVWATAGALLSSVCPFNFLTSSTVPPVDRRLSIRARLCDKRLEGETVRKSREKRRLLLTDCLRLSGLISSDETVDSSVFSLRFLPGEKLKCSGEASPGGDVIDRLIAV